MSIFVNMKFEFYKGKVRAENLDDRALDEVIRPRLDDEMKDYFSIVHLDGHSPHMIVTEISVEVDSDDLWTIRDTMAAWLADGMVGWDGDLAYGSARDLDSGEVGYWAVGSTKNSMFEAYERLVAETMHHSLQETVRQNCAKVMGDYERIRIEPRSHESNGKEDLVWEL